MINPPSTGVAPLPFVMLGRICCVVCFVISSGRGGERVELNSGKFKVDMTAGKNLVELMKSRDGRVRLDATKYYTTRRMGWKETNVNENVGRDGGPIETKDVSAIDIIRARIASASARLEEGENPSESE
jgi:hypothetical protein